MGITINYQGKIKDMALIPKLVSEFKDFSVTAGWRYRVIDDWPALSGIVLDIHPECETFFLTFGEDGKLTRLYEYKDDEGRIKVGEQRSLFVKTQFAGVKVHIIIIKLLEYLKKKYIPNLRVEDEGDFWEKREIRVLEENFAIVQSAIDKLGRVLETHCSGKIVDPPYDKIIQEITQLISSIPYQEPDITENEQSDDLLDDNCDPSNPDDIYTEEQWEEFFEKNEKLIDKYEKVYQENPERDWKHPYDLYCKVHYGIDFREDFSFGDLKDDKGGVFGIGEELDLERGSYSPSLVDERELERKTHPILGESYEFSMAVMDFVKNLEKRKDIQEALSKFVSAALQISAKLHGGHGMGYEKDVLEGNIATCKIALRNANLSLEALEELNPQIGDLISFAKIDEKLRQLKINVEDWIAELRGRVLWR